MVRKDDLGKFEELRLPLDLWNHDPLKGSLSALFERGRQKRLGVAQWNPTSPALQAETFPYQPHEPVNSGRGYLSVAAAASGQNHSRSPGEIHRWVNVRAT